MKIIEPNPPTGSDFFNSLWKSQTWMNLLYLLLSFPLGIFYFVVLVTGISLGFGLLITVFGIFILFGVLMLVRALSKFEAEFTNVLLGTQIRPPDIPSEVSGFWKRFREKLVSAFTWKGMFFLFLRFPMGTFSFSVTISLLAASLGLISTPFLYNSPWFNVEWPNNSWWYIDTFPEALVLAIIGIFLLFASLFALNWIAWAYGKVAKALLE